MTADTAPRPRILVVEDEALIAEEIQERLTSLNYDVVGIEDTGERAIDAVGRTHPDLVLMDVRLKGVMDGIEATDRIRQHSDVPVIYLTAHSDQATLQRAKGTGPLGYILKPFQERDLLVTIEMALHRHSIERQLTESRIRYATTLASIGDAVLATDADGRVTFMNPVAEALTGWRAQDAIGVPVWQVFVVIDERIREALENPITTALARRAVVSLARPILLIAKDGAVIPIDDSAAPILDERGAVTGAVVAFRDIRRRRLAEDSLRHAEDQLRQSQKMESIGRLAEGVAHDFNNLLTVINGCTDLLLKKQTMDDDAKQLVREIRIAGDRSAALTRQLLLFGRRTPLEPAPVNLNRIIADAKPMLERLLGEEVLLTVTLHPELEQVKADAVQLEQVLLNLVINARDAMPSGGRLTIGTENVVVDELGAESRPEMPPGRYVLLRVSDTGIGMDNETKARIFDPFFTTKKAGAGTGLGLATAYSVVKQSGGTIYVNTASKRGASFHVYLPAVREAASPGAPAVELTASPRGEETILLVEDEESVRAFTALVLQGLGYTVLPASDGAEARRISERFTSPIELLVTDVVMPGMSGPELAESLLASRPGLRVLFLSGYADETVARHGVDEEGSDFLQKPFTATTLGKKVREVLDEEPVRV